MKRNKMFHAIEYGGSIIYTILAGVSSRNHYYVAVEL